MILIISLLGTSLSAQIPTHQNFSAQLAKFVSETGTVDYAGWKAEETALDAYLAELAKSTPQGYWNNNQKLAYWINTYNAFTVKLILDHYPLTSIRDLHDGNPWDVKWITLAGRKYSLNQIENEIIRPDFKDPRIHFAVNCAAASCPPLLNRAFLPQSLDAQLEKRAKLFINNPAFNTQSGPVFETSQIFNWYGEDFGKLIDYLNQYRDSKLPAGTQIRFKEYDWALNGK